MPLEAQVAEWIGKGSAGAVLLGVLYGFTQWIVSRKPRRTADVEHQGQLLGLQQQERDSYEARLASMGKELDKQREKIDTLEKRLEKLVGERYYVYDLLIRLAAEHPPTSAWIVQEIATMRERFGD